MNIEKIVDHLHVNKRVAWLALILVLLVAGVWFYEIKLLIQHRAAITPSEWLFRQGQESIAAWVQGLGAIAAIYVTQRIASSSERVSNEKEAAQRRQRGIGEMMALLVATQQAKITLGSAHVALGQIRQTTDATKIRALFKRTVIAFPHGLNHALRGADIFEDHIRNRLFPAAHHFSAFVHWATETEELIQGMDEIGLVNFLARDKIETTPEMLTDLQLKYYVKSKDCLDALDYSLRKQIEIATGTAFDVYAR